MIKEGRIVMSSATLLLLMAVLLILEWQFCQAYRPPLPKCNNVKMKVLFPVSLSKQSCYPAFWSPDLKLSWPDDENITIKFDPPPKESAFKRFFVKLKKDGKLLDQREIKTYHITYTLKCNGLYNFIIRPIDEFQWQVSNCSCYDSRERCQWCKETSKDINFSTGIDCPRPKPTYTRNESGVTEIMTSTQNLTIPIVKVPETDDKDDPIVEENTSLPQVSHSNADGAFGDSKATTIILISLGIMVAVILALIFVYFMFKSKNSSSAAILQNYDNLVTEDEAMTTKNVLFLFSNDHDFHYNVVNCLASSLESHFKCHILYTPCITEKGILQWLHKMVAECDAVLLLHSESVKRQCDAWRVGKEYSQLRDDPNESTLMPILAHIQNCPKVQPYYSKFVSCRLKHLPEKYTLHEFPSRDNFVLMKELKELVCRLHQLPPTGNLKKAFKTSFESYQNTPKRQSLIQAIERAATYEENQNWFLDKYKCAEYCTESTTDKCDCTSIFISDFQNGGLGYLKAPVEGQHDRGLPKPYFTDINSVSDISHCSTMLADINERNDRSLKNRNSFLETLPDDMHDLSM